jgi:hypothetical protein
MNIKLSTIALIAFGSIMAFTNPDRQEYLDYASRNLTNELPKILCNTSEIENFFDFSDGNLVNFCKSGLGFGLNLGQESIKKFIDKNTQEQNFVLLSIYKTRIPGREYKNFGIFDNFITFQSK